MKETDAIALFPGGFGTQDEAFETLTLIQTGKATPVPIILLDHPGGDYWKEWDRYIRDNLLDRHLISPDDLSIYTMTDNLDAAWAEITHFYRVFHSMRYLGESLIFRLNCPLRPDAIEELNHRFSDILTHGEITTRTTLSPEKGDDIEQLPRLVIPFNNRDFGRLYQLIRAVNSLGIPSPALAHPEQK